MTELYITRHGETMWNQEGRFQGRQNSDLTARGREQALSLRRVLDEADIDLILTSPLQRALETAQIARGDRPIPILILDSLMELDLGQWEGELLDELRSREPEAYHDYWHDPFRFEPRGGESYEAMISRLGEAMEEILALAEGKRALVVTHGMALMAILHHVTGQDFAAILAQPVLAQTSITRVRVADPDQPVYEVHSIGDTAHFGSAQLHPPADSVWNNRRVIRESPGERAARLMVASRQTIATAESLTGGALAAALIDSEAGISASFLEGYITYSNQAKIRDLGVRSETLERFGAVSAETAREMVAGAQAKSGTDFALATTGIAGPTGGSAEKPVGLTWIGLWHHGEIEVRREVFSGDRRAIRQAAVDTALNWLIDKLENADQASPSQD